MVKAKKCVYVDLEKDYLEELVDSVANQMSKLYIELLEMLHKCRDLQQIIQQSRQSPLEIIDNINIDNDVVLIY